MNTRQHAILKTGLSILMTGLIVLISDPQGPGASGALHVTSSPGLFGDLTPMPDKALVTLTEPTEGGLVSLVTALSFAPSDFAIDPRRATLFFVEGNADDMTSLLSALREHPAVRAAEPIYRDENGNEVAVTDEILVVFNEDVDRAQKRQLHQALGARIMRATPWYDILQVARHNAALLVAEQYQASALVRYAHANVLLQAAAMDLPNDEYFGQQFPLHNTGQTLHDGHAGTVDADVDAPDAWTITKGDPDVVVAVFDEGVEIDHPDLVDRIWVNQDEFPGDSNDDGCPGVCGIDDDGDGLTDEDRAEESSPLLVEDFRGSWFTPPLRPTARPRSSALVGSLREASEDA